MESKLKEAIHRADFTTCDELFKETDDRHTGNANVRLLSSPRADTLASLRESPYSGRPQPVT